MEYLRRAEFDRKDAARGVVRLIRTEAKAVMEAAGLKPGDTGVTLKRGVAESTSIYRQFNLYGTERTEQDVPFHRIIGTYWQSRSPAGYEASSGLFLGDHENEFVAMLDGIPLDYTKRGGG